MKNVKNVLKPVMIDTRGSVKTMSFDIGHKRILTLIDNTFRGGLDISILPVETFCRDILGSKSSEKPVLTVDIEKEPLLEHVPYGYYKTDHIEKLVEETRKTIINFYGELIFNEGGLIINESYEPLKFNEEFLIKEFFEEEYGHGYFYNGERFVHLAYTEDDYGHPLEVVLDLKEKVIKKELFISDKESIIEYTNKYDSDLISVLESLDFSELTMMEYEYEEI